MYTEAIKSLQKSLVLKRRDVREAKKIFKDASLRFEKNASASNYVRLENSARYLQDTNAELADMQGKLNKQLVEAGL